MPLNSDKRGPAISDVEVFFIFISLTCSLLLHSVISTSANNANLFGAATNEANLFSLKQKKNKSKRVLDVLQLHIKRI